MRETQHTQRNPEHLIGRFSPSCTAGVCFSLGCSAQHFQLLFLSPSECVHTSFSEVFSALTVIREKNPRTERYSGIRTVTVKAVHKWGGVTHKGRGLSLSSFLIIILSVSLIVFVSHSVCPSSVCVSVYLSIHSSFHLPTFLSLSLSL